MGDGGAARCGARRTAVRLYGDARLPLTQRHSSSVFLKKIKQKSIPIKK
jgi:hypothetical protein